jgi:hypothetical protein
MDQISLITTGPSAEELIGQLALLPRDVQLRRVLELLSATNECAEWLGQLASQAWAYLVQNELWNAASLSLDEVKAIIDWPEVCGRIEAYRHTQRRRERDGKGIRRHWGCSAKEALSAAMRLRHLPAKSTAASPPAEQKHANWAELGLCSAR